MKKIPVAIFLIMALTIQTIGAQPAEVARPNYISKLKKSWNSFKAKLDAYRTCLRNRSCTRKERRELFAIGLTLLAVLIVGGTVITKQSLKKKYPRREDLLRLAQAVRDNNFDDTKRSIDSMKSRNTNMPLATNITVDTIHLDNIPLLVLAAKGGDEEIVILLLANGANPNIGLPLHNAVLNLHTNVASALLKQGAQINQQEGVTGSTPLMIAAQLCYAPMIDLLLQYAPDKTLKDNEGRTAYDRAGEVLDEKCDRGRILKKLNP